MAGMARLGEAGPGAARRFTAGEARPGAARRGVARLGRAGRFTAGMAKRGGAGLGSAIHRRQIQGRKEEKCPDVKVA